MPVLDVPAILARNRARTERVRGLGINEEEERNYYGALPYGYSDAQMERAAFASLILGKELSREEELLIKQHLDDRDPR